MLQSKKNGNVLAGIKALLALSLSTILCFIPILFIGLLKLFPNRRWQAFCSQWIDSIVSLWVSNNNAYIKRTQNINWEIHGLDNLDPKQWYLVLANHQSWLDIVILHRLFNRKIPTLKFFIKDQLKWVPFLGFAWWAMGCPFMKRYSKEYLAKNPHKKGRDLQATQKAVKHFQQSPSSIMSFVEGTRFSQEKNQKQNSPYQHLLKPKAGGISFVMSTMGKQFNSIIDVTIIYGDKNPSLWDFLCKRMGRIKIYIRQLSIPEEFTTPSLVNDHQTQADFRNWLNQYWFEKDQLMIKTQIPCHKT